MFLESIGRTIGDIFGFNKKKREEQPRPIPASRPQPGSRAFNTGVSQFRTSAVQPRPVRPSTVGQPIRQEPDPTTKIFTGVADFVTGGGIKTIGNAIASGGGYIGKTISGEDARERDEMIASRIKSEQLRRQANSTILIRPDQKARMLREAQGASNIADTIARQRSEERRRVLSDTDPLKVAAGIANTGLAVVAPGAGKLAGTVASKVSTLPKVLPKVVGGATAGGAGGAGYGVLGQLQQTGVETKPLDLAASAAVGAGTGAVLGGGLPAAIAGSKAVVKRAQDIQAQPGYSPQAGFMKTSSSKPVVKSREPAKPTVSINPDDPFGNTGSRLARIKGEASKLIDDDAQMITMLKKVEKDTGKTGLVDQWLFDTGNVRASNAMANAKLRNSSELSGAIKGLSKKNLKEFDEYAAARAELKNYEGLPTSKTTAELQTTVGKLGEKYEQRFGELNKYYKNLAQEMHAGGLIDDARLKNYQASDDYVRIQRDMEDLIGQKFGGSRSRSIGTTTATQKRKGSQREILSPTASAAKRTQQIQLEINRNKAAINTIDLLSEIGLAKRAKDTTNKNTISRLMNGKREIYEVPADIKKVVDNVNPYQLGVIAQIISAPTRLLRAGTTALSAPFTAVNYLRDQQSSALYSKDVLTTHNPAHIISGLKNATIDTLGNSKNPIWDKFEQYIGDQTVFDELRNVKDTNKLLREVRLGARGRVGNAVISPIRTFEDLNSITEKATRFQNFKGVYEKTLKATGDEQEAIKQAVLAARQNSVDFQRSSAFTRAMNLFIPYFNASTQGTRNVLRSFRDRPVATTVKSIGMIALPTVATTMWNLSDPTRREAYDSISDFEKEDNFIIIGPDAKQRDDGSWEGIYKIPKAQGYRELTDPVRDVTEAFLKGEAVEDVADMFKDTLGALTGPFNIESGEQFIGSITPQQIKPAVQLGMNKDLYSGGKIVPDYMQEETDDPTKRRFDSTSGSARLIAEALGVSPIQVEKFITDTTGSLGRYGINAADTALASVGAVSPDEIGGRSVADDFSRRLFEAKGELLEKNKSGGQKYFEDVKTVTEGLNPNELAAFKSLHPKKTNFLGEDIFDENKRVTNLTRAGAYMNNPGVLEADRKLDRLQRERGKPGNPLFDLPDPLLKKVLWKSTLPPGSKDPELSSLYREPWYQDYQNARSKYYDQVKASLAAEGKELPKSNNPYPETPPDLQKAMDFYSSLSKGTGERSAWIKANQGVWQQMTAQWAQVDAWENKERVAVGLNPIEEEGSMASGSSGFRGGRKGSGLGKSQYAYSVSPKAGGEFKKPTVKAKKTEAIKIASRKAVAPKVSMKKSAV